MSQSIQENSLRAIAVQRKRKLSQLEGNILDQLPEAINLSALIDDFMPEHRSRCFTPSVTLNLFLRQVLSDDQSCQQIVLQSY